MRPDINNKRFLKAYKCFSYRDQYHNPEQKRKRKERYEVESRGMFIVRKCYVWSIPTDSNLIIGEHLSGNSVDYYDQAEGVLSWSWILIEN